MVVKSVIGFCYVFLKLKWKPLLFMPGSKYRWAIPICSIISIVREWIVKDFEVWCGTGSRSIRRHLTPRRRSSPAAIRPVGPPPTIRTGASALPSEEIEPNRSEEHTSELQSLMRNSYAVFCLKKKKQISLDNN